MLDYIVFFVIMGFVAKINERKNQTNPNRSRFRSLS